jgi:hypothetical protein
LFYITKATPKSPSTIKHKEEMELQKKFAPHLAAILGLSLPKLNSTIVWYAHLAPFLTDAHQLFYLSTFQLMHILFVDILFVDIGFFKIFVVGKYLHSQLPHLLWRHSAWFNQCLRSAPSYPWHQVLPQLFPCTHCLHTTTLFPSTTAFTSISA